MNGREISLLLLQEPDSFLNAGRDADPVYGPLRLGAAVLAPLTSQERDVLMAKLGSARAQIWRAWPHLIGHMATHQEALPEMFDLADDLHELHELHFSGRRPAAEWECQAAGPAGPGRLDVLDVDGDLAFMMFR